jgi:hypothetical protein
MAWQVTIDKLALTDIVVSSCLVIQTHNTYQQNVVFCRRLITLAVLMMVILMYIFFSYSSGQGDRTTTTPASKLSASCRHLRTTAFAADVIVPNVSGRTEVILPDVAKQVLDQEKAGKGRKLIAMSLFGDDPRYVQGALLNAVLAQRDWPEWTLRFYYGDGVPENALGVLRNLGAETVKMNLVQNARVSMYWRFFALEDRTATRIISRDADAQLSQRDRAAVNEWIDSGRFFHTMHDHPSQGVPVAGGMWGAVNGFINPQIMHAWRQSKDQSSAVWGNDQQWLRHVVWPMVKNHTLDHSSFWCHKFGAKEWRGFPSRRLHLYDFVGNVYQPKQGFVGFPVKAVCPLNCRRRPEWESC